MHEHSSALVPSTSVPVQCTFNGVMYQCTSASVLGAPLSPHWNARLPKQKTWLGLPQYGRSLLASVDAVTKFSSRVKRGGCICCKRWEPASRLLYCAVQYEAGDAALGAYLNTCDAYLGSGYFPHGCASSHDMHSWDRSSMHCIS